MSDTETFQVFSIGEFVQMKCPPERIKERFAYGRIMAEERYRDDHGSRTWVYVQWVSGDGKPDRDMTKHSARELERFTK